MSTTLFSLRNLLFQRDGSNKIKYSSSAYPRGSQSGVPGTSTIGITWELVRNAASQPPPPHPHRQIQKLQGWARPTSAAGSRCSGRRIQMRRGGRRKKRSWLCPSLLPAPLGRWGNPSSRRLVVQPVVLIWSQGLRRTPHLAPILPVTAALTLFKASKRACPV